MQAKDTTKRTVLITGCDNEVGKAVGKRFVQSGYCVVMTCLDDQCCGTLKTEMEKECSTTKTTTSTSTSIKCMKLDLSNLDSIKACCKQIETQCGVVDVLINNASVYPSTKKPTEFDDKGLRETFDVNFFGTVAFTQMMIPYMRHGTDKTIINVSSDLGSLCLQNYSDFKFRHCNTLAYHCSKTALNGFTVGLSKELSCDGFRVNSVSTGYFSTKQMTETIKKPEDSASTIFNWATCQSCGTGRNLGDDWGMVPW